MAGKAPLPAMTAALAQLTEAFKLAGATSATPVLEIIVPPGDEEALRLFFDAWRTRDMPDHIIGMIGKTVVKTLSRGWVDPP